MTAPLSTVDPTAVADLVDDLRDLLGPRGISTDPRQREKASEDGAAMSPILLAQLPLGHADVVAFPATPADRRRRRRRGAPRRADHPARQGHRQLRPGHPDGGRARARHCPGPHDHRGRRRRHHRRGRRHDGRHRASGRRTTGQQILMYPSTAQSHDRRLPLRRLGRHRLDQARHEHTRASCSRSTSSTPSGDAALVHVEGPRPQPYVHNYGTAGIIARATVRLEPLQDWQGLFASFPTLRAGALGDPPDRPARAHAAAGLGRPADARRGAAGRPGHPAPAGRACGPILDPPSLDAAARRRGGRRPGRGRPRRARSTIMRISMLSYNHPIEWLQKAYPDTYFHLEVGGDALVDRIDEVARGVPRRDAAHRGRSTGARSACSPASTARPRRCTPASTALRRAGVGVHNPHQWYRRLRGRPRPASSPRATDPGGLLNPGKLR